MPPRVRVTKEDIVSSALELVRKKGAEGLNARELAAEMGCSTQPIFSNFAGMEELQSAVALAAYERYVAFLKNESKSGKYPPYKAFGMAYIRFAREERELFKLLFMCDRGGKSIDPTPDFVDSVNMIAAANGISRETAEQMHMEMWICVHGIATMHATSFLSLDWDVISHMLSDVYQGIRKNLKDAENERN